MLFLAYLITAQRFKLRDFEVYYTAAKHLITGQQVYGIPFGLGSGYYKYSPFALFLFIPLAALPFPISKLIYYFILASAVIFGIYFSDKILRKFVFSSVEPHPTDRVILLTALIGGFHYYRELILGNINMILLGILLIALTISNTDRFKRSFISQSGSGLLLAIAIMIKPHFIIFLPALAFRKKWWALKGAIAGIVFAFFFPLVLGFQKATRLTMDWFNIMKLHNESVVGAENTIFAWTNKIFFGRHIHIPEKILFISLLCLVALAIAGIIYFNRRSENKTSGQDKQKMIISDWTFEFFMLLALVPNLTKTDTEHFLLSTPLILFLLSALNHPVQIKKTSKWILISIVCLAFILYGGNWHDLIGDKLSKLWDDFGLLGLGNMLIILCALVVHGLRRKTHKTAEI